MTDRMQINEEDLDCVVGGTLTYRWRKSTKGFAGLNGNYIYAFDDRQVFLDMLNECMVVKYMTDAETLQAMLAAGVIHPIV